MCLFGKRTAGGFARPLQACAVARLSERTEPPRSSKGLLYELDTGATQRKAARERHHSHGVPRISRQVRPSPSLHLCRPTGRVRGEPCGGQVCSRDLSRGARTASRGEPGGRGLAYDDGAHRRVRRRRRRRRRGRCWRGRCRRRRRRSALFHGGRNFVVDDSCVARDFRRSDEAQPFQRSPARSSLDAQSRNRTAGAH